MSIWIKICGNTSLDDTRLAVDAGADAVGFVFAPSPRRVTVPEVASIVAHLASPVEKIGVFVDAGFEEVYEAVRVCGLTGVQLHSAAGPEMPAKAAPKARTRFESSARVALRSRCSRSNHCRDCRA